MGCKKFVCQHIYTSINLSLAKPFGPELIKQTKSKRRPMLTFPCLVSMSFSSVAGQFLFLCFLLCVFLTRIWQLNFSMLAQGPRGVKGKFILQRAYFLFFLLYKPLILVHLLNFVLIYSGFIKCCCLLNLLES